ncbi:unnamed protein product [Sympodiomycopsis kandeliae]
MEILKLDRESQIPRDIAFSNASVLALDFSGATIDNSVFNPLSTTPLSAERGWQETLLESYEATTGTWVARH